MHRPVLALALCSTLAACASILGVGGDYADQPADAGVADVVTPTIDGANDDAAGNVDASSGDATDLDTGKDTAPPPCSGHICNGVCLPGTTCVGCAQELFCAVDHTCVSTCGMCGSGAGLVECWACPGTGAQGSCEPVATAYCMGSAYAHCPCADAAADCPGANQICNGTDCLACGASGTDGRKCRSRTCDAEKRTCN